MDFLLLLFALLGSPTTPAAAAQDDLSTPTQTEPASPPAPTPNDGADGADDARGRSIYIHGTN